MELIVSIFLIIHGLYSYYAVFKNKKTIHLELPVTSYLSEKILGKYFDKWHNFFWGTIELIIGIVSFIYFLKKY